MSAFFAIPPFLIAPLPFKISALVIFPSPVKSGNALPPFLNSSLGLIL
jgi:hypothetical protein